MVVDCATLISSDNKLQSPFKLPILISKLKCNTSMELTHILLLNP